MQAYFTDGIAGVERVLGPSALELLQVTSPGAETSFVVAEPGVSFTPGARAVGHPEPDASPVLLGTGAIAIGMLVLLASVIWERVRELDTDPYRNVQR